MKHLVRDWSDEGRPERDALFPPILNALTTEFAEADAPNRILVPGCGVGRLAYEIGALGKSRIVSVRFSTALDELISLVQASQLMRMTVSLVLPCPSFIRRDSVRLVPSHQTPP